MVKKPLTPSQPRLCFVQQPQRWALSAVPGPGCPEGTCCTGAGRGDAADTKLGTAQARSEPLLLPSFQGSHKAASLTSTCFFQAFTTQVRASAVKLKMSSVTYLWPGPPCHHLVSLEAPSPNPHSHTDSRAQHSHGSEGPTPQHTLSLSPSASVTPESTASATGQVPDIEALSPAVSSNKSSHFTVMISVTE